MTALSSEEVRLTRRDAVKLGFVGGVLVGLPSYVFAGEPANMINNLDSAVIAGILIRMALFGGLGAGYGYLVPLPSDKWSALERGIMAPGIIAAMLFTQTPSRDKLDAELNNQAFNMPLISSAYADPRTPASPRTPTTIRQIIRGVLGK
jgi:hypothetical protein